MQSDLDRKLRQMYAALGATRQEDISSITAQIVETPRFSSIEIDFNASSDPIELQNKATLLVGNIACLKDHLRAWCRSASVPFKGDALIDANAAVAIVHDLWNIDKHLELDRPPRSGHKPKLQGMRTAMQFSTGDAAGSSVFMTFDKNGKPVVRSSGGATAMLVLIAEVVDENGLRLGDFLQICTEAADAWEHELRAAGVQIPTR